MANNTFKILVTGEDGTYVKARSKAKDVYALNCFDTEENVQIEMEPGDMSKFIAGLIALQKENDESYEEEKPSE